LHLVELYPHPLRLFFSVSVLNFRTLLPELDWPLEVLDVPESAPEMCGQSEGPGKPAADDNYCSLQSLPGLLRPNQGLSMAKTLLIARLVQAVKGPVARLPLPDFQPLCLWSFSFC
jgi:hypothetical protein